MLKRIHIKAFRSCQEIVISDMGSVVALIGRNGAGKTNILKAIECLGVVTSSSGKAALNDIPVEIGADVELGEGRLYRYEYAAHIEPVDLVALDKEFASKLEITESLSLKDDSQSWKKLVFRNNEDVEIYASNNGIKSIKTGFLASCLPALLSLLPTNDPTSELIRPLLGFLAGIRYYALDEATELPARIDESWGFIPQDAYEKWLASYKDTGDPGWSVAFRLIHMSQVQKEKFEELSSLLGPDGLGLIDKIYVGAINLQVQSGTAKTPPDQPGQKFFNVRFLPSQSAGAQEARLFSYRELSLGTRRVLRILTSMVFDEKTIMLMEHPEDGIHTGLVKKLASLLRTNADPMQVILASHSSTVLSMLLPSDVRLVVMRKGKTEVSALKPNELETAKRYMAEEGTMADFLSMIEED